MRCRASKCSIKIAPNRRRATVLGIVFRLVDTNAFSVAPTVLLAAIEARSRYAKRTHHRVLRRGGGLERVFRKGKDELMTGIRTTNSKTAVTFEFASR